MSAELVRVTIDELVVHVAEGHGPRRDGARAPASRSPSSVTSRGSATPIGACRMCLVEIEGMPKLQAGCTLTAQDGMVVKTARTSAKAAEGQNATLEFILVNHPLDCPVCDKGGECPLQDLTFRYGPGNTRMRFPKVTLEKPIPISPTISLDRERCILCYRCTRFSEQVSEDGQLVAKNRGAMSVITTFDDEPYSSAFSGNVTELCPVGALLPTQYRFEGRPWEITSVPTVCGMCPVGCNTWVDMREGKAKRVRSRNHHEIDEGWLCDKGRFGVHAPALDRPHRRPDPARAAPRLRARLLGRRARRGRAAAARGARPRRRRALRLRDDRAGVRAREARAPGHRLARGDAARGGHERARRVPPAALRDRRREGRRGARRRAARRERADRRPLGAQGAPERRARRDERRRRRGRREDGADLVGPGRPRRRHRRAARREARPRGPGRQRRVLRARDAERPRHRRRVGRRVRRRGRATWTRSAC